VVDPEELDVSDGAYDGVNDGVGLGFGFAGVLFVIAFAGEGLELLVVVKGRVVYGKFHV